ncbi:ImuA family protein [Acetobacter sp. UBA5411]|uniref:ImuA family protein n=1 Tax=Acetobacter sp. UBA5411 TaxID=1945905 RepID=UPI0025C468B5|nr:damage-inducible protein [Acetobacter sp. UBA5411]
MAGRTADTLALLRDEIRRMERHHAAAGMDAYLPTGFTALDEWLGGGLSRGRVHEFLGTGCDRALLARPTRFVAHVLARTPGQVVWLAAHHLNLHAAGLQGAGLAPGRLICVQSETRDLLPLCEDILRERGIAALVCDLCVPLSLTASRRLQLAAESSGTTGFLLRPTTNGAVPPPSACETRWRIGAARPVSLNNVIGPEHWRIELLRSRDGRPFTWTYGLPGHATDPLDLASPVAHGSVAASPPAGEHRDGACAA